jgi:DNA-binding NarL/FixJ family response regulator
MGSISPITVVIADRDKKSRAACLCLLQPEKAIQVVGEVRGAIEAIKAVTKLKPRILLLGFNLLSGERIALLTALCQKSPRTKIILLIRYASDARILEALGLGARGYIEEKAISSFLVKAVCKVDAGGAWVPRRIVAMVAKIIDRLSCITH